MSQAEIIKFQMDIRVDDPQAYWDAARVRATEDGYHDITDLEMGTRDQPDLGDCSTMIFDPGLAPGCTILQSEGSVLPRLPSDKHPMVRFVMEVEVVNAGEFYEAASKHLREIGTQGAAAEALIGTREEPDLAHCAVVVFDPGTVGGGSILASSAETMQLGVMRQSPSSDRESGPSFG